jgi:hypothetical protein
LQHDRFEIVVAVRQWLLVAVGHPGEYRRHAFRDFEVNLTARLETLLARKALTATGKRFSIPKWLATSICTCEDAKYDRARIAQREPNGPG